MIPAFIVLTVVACGLGGFIAYTEIRDKKKGATERATVTAEIAQENKEDAASDVLPTDGEDGSDASSTAEEPASDVSPTDEEGSETDETESEEADEENDDEVTQVQPVAENGKTRYIVVRYSKSFLAKLIQSDDETKRYYSALKNRLLSFVGVKSRIAWKCETFHKGRKTLAKLRLRGKTLSLCLALDAEAYADTKYKVEDIAHVKSYAATPCMYRIRNDRRLAYGKELAVALMAQYGIPEKPIEETDYAAKYPYESDETLIGRKQIKKLNAPSPSEK